MLEFLVDAPSFMKRGGAVQNIQEKLSASFTSGLDGATLPINFSQMELNISSVVQPPIYTLMHVFTANQNDHKHDMISTWMLSECSSLRSLFPLTVKTARWCEG